MTTRPGPLAGLPRRRAGDVGGRAVGRRPAGRLGRRRGQGRAAGRRSAAQRLRRHRRRRPGRRAAVRARQPRQALGRARPPAARRTRADGAAARDRRRVRDERPSGCARTARPRPRRRCSPATRGSSTRASPGTGSRAPSATAPATTSARTGRAAASRTRSCRRASCRRRCAAGWAITSPASASRPASSPSCSSGSAPAAGGLVATSLLRAGMYSLGWDIGIVLRFGRRQSTRPRERHTAPLVNCYRAGDGTGVLAAAASRRLATGRSWSPRSASSELAADERFVDAGAAGEEQRASSSPRSTRRSRSTTYDELTAALRRARRLVGADQLDRRRHRRPAGRGVRRLRRHDASRRRGALPRRQRPGRLRRLHVPCPARCRPSASTPTRSSASSTHADHCRPAASVRRTRRSASGDRQEPVRERARQAWRVSGRRGRGRRGALRPRRSCRRRRPRARRTGRTGAA